MLKKFALRGVKTLTVFYFVFLLLFGAENALSEKNVSALPEKEADPCFSAAADTTAAASGEKRVILGGELFGLRMQTKGLLVTSLEKISSAGRDVSPGAAAGLLPGDVILSAKGIALEDAASFSKIISRSEGKAVSLTVLRQGAETQLSLTPCLSDSGGYKAGIWVRDGAAGIGTVTFKDPESGVFGGLGHGVCDSATGCVFPFAKGEVCTAQLDRIKKGENGTPGELHGKLSPDAVGTLLDNTSQGVFGILPVSEKEKTVPVGAKEEVKKGEATILCTLDDEGKKEYEVRIEEIFSEDRKTKNFVLCITSPALLEKTGGIVQGM